MGPNLTRLYKLAKSESVKEREYEQMVEAENRLHDLFDTHGEALIAALEKLVDRCDTPADYDVAYHTAKQLLAQLESEAQP